MWVSNVELTNIRGFHGDRKVKLALPGTPGWVVLAGGNGTGRTTFLEAVALALGGPAAARERTGPDWISDGESSALARVRLGPAAAGLTWHSTDGGTPAVTRALPRSTVAAVFFAFLSGTEASAALPDSTVDAPGVVLIDEVDAHLDLNAQRNIAAVLRGRYPNLQFIVATNSPYVCQAADAIIMLHGPPRLADEALYQRVVYGSGDDIALSELFNLASPYSDRAVAARRELVELEAAVLSGRAGRRDTARYTALRDLLTSSPPTRVAEVAHRLDRP